MTENTTIEQIGKQDEQQNYPQAETNTAATAEPSNEPTREQLLELYERRVKPAMLESAEASCSTNFTGLLENEGLGILDGADLIPGGAQERAPLYMRTPVGEGNSEGIDIPQARVTVDSQEDAEIQPETCPVLSPDDQGLLGTLRDRGQAATFSEAACHAGSAMDRLAGGDFAHNGTAFYRNHRGHTLPALAGATEADLDRAANRAEAERIEVAFSGSVTAANVVSGALVERLQRLGGSSSFDGVRSQLAARGHNRKAIHAVMGELYRRGSIRISIRGKTPEGGERDTRPRFVTLANAPEGALAVAAERYADDQKEIPARRAEAADRARSRGQDKGFMAPWVPFGGTRVNPAEQARALYIERAKARYNEANPKGVHEVTLRLAATSEEEGGLEAEEKVLYKADATSAADFFRARIKARILTGLERNGVLAASRIVSVLFPEKAPEIIGMLREGRTLSPQLAEPYAMFTSAANELIEEGKAARTRDGRLALADPDEKQALARQVEVKDRADEDPEPERESGPDAHGEDKYASDMAGAHDHRAIASGPQAPSRRPGQRKKAARRIGSAIRKAKAARDAPATAEASLRKAECNQAWNEARARYMEMLDPEDRLELYLQLEGEQRLERMVEAAYEPDELHRAAIVLKDKGRISVRTSGGYTLICANAEADRTALADELVAVMARKDIPVPEGAALAGRVAAAREKAATVAA